MLIVETVARIQRELFRQGQVDQGNRTGSWPVAQYGAQNAAVGPALAEGGAMGERSGPIAGDQRTHASAQPATIL